MQPDEGALDHAVCYVDVAAMPAAALGELRTDSSLAQDTVTALAIASTVGLHAPRFVQGRAGHAARRLQAPRSVGGPSRGRRSSWT